MRDSIYGFDRDIYNEYMLEAILKERDPTFSPLSGWQKITKILIRLQELDQEDPGWLELVWERKSFPPNFSGLSPMQAYLVGRHYGMKYLPGVPASPLVVQLVLIMLEKTYRPYSKEQLQAIFAESSELDGLMEMSINNVREGYRTMPDISPYEEIVRRFQPQYIPDNELYRGYLKWYSDSSDNSRYLILNYLFPRGFNRSIYSRTRLQRQRFQELYHYQEIPGIPLNWMTRPRHPLEDILTHLEEYTPREILFLGELWKSATLSVGPGMFSKDQEYLISIFSRLENRPTDFESIFLSGGWSGEVEDYTHFADIHKKTMWFLRISGTTEDSQEYPGNLPEDGNLTVALGTFTNYTLYTLVDLYEMFSQGTFEDREFTEVEVGDLHALLSEFPQVGWIGELSRLIGGECGRI